MAEIFGWLLAATAAIVLGSLPGAVRRPASRPRPARGPRRRGGPIAG